MDCWICLHGSRQSAEQVGVCHQCSIVACDDHGDRPTKGKFHCFVCLQRIALNTAGLPGDEEALVIAPQEAMLDPGELDRLAESVSLELDRVPRAAWTLLPSDEELKRRAVAVAWALAYRCFDPHAEDRGERASVADVVDPRLVAQWMDQ